MATDPITTIPEDGGLTGIALMARNSLYSLRSTSLASVTLQNSLSDSTDDRTWSWRYLRATFAVKDLELLYERYRQRLLHINFQSYLILQILLSGSLIISVLACNTNGELIALPEVIGHSILVATSVGLLITTKNENVVVFYPKLHSFLSFGMTVLMVAVDIGMAIYFVLSGQGSLHVPAAFYTIMVAHTLLPTASHLEALMLGVGVSVAHLTGSVLLVYQHEERVYQRTAADMVYYISCNCIGIYARFLTEITLRRAFLDRRSCIETTFLLDYERDQEEQLMLSILPKHITSQVKQDLRAVFLNMHLPKKTFSELYIEKHRNVSILFADIVNFTKLTTTLSVAELVEMLNDLFGKFDDAADRNGCMRIKILGDCYNCISGLSADTPSHARNCVKMGFEMIDVIRGVREDRCVDVDMRIGIHTGYVLCGLLGIRKWQFDIWSRDVTIANHMEQAGSPGRIHISRATMEQLGVDYSYSPGYGLLRDSYLAEYGVETFFVIPPGTKLLAEKKLGITPSPSDASLSSVDVSHLPVTELNEVEYADSGVDMKSSTDTSPEHSKPDVLADTLTVLASKQGSAKLEESDTRSTVDTAPQLLPFQRNPRRTSFAVPDDGIDGNSWRSRPKTGRSNSSIGPVSKQLNYTSRRRSTASEVGRRRAVLMDSSLIGYRKLISRANSHMATAIESMPVSKTKSLQTIGVNPVTLIFRDADRERSYIKQADPLFKSYFLGAFSILIGMGAIQGILGSTNFVYWGIYGLLFVTFAVLIPCTWMGSLYLQWNDPYRESDTLPSMGWLTTLQSVARRIESSLALRVSLFIILTCMTCAIAIVDIWECNPVSNGTITGFANQSSTYENGGAACMYPWYFTYSCSLALGASYVFFRIHLMLKTFVMIVALLGYTSIMLHFPDIFTELDNQDLYNGSPALTPILAHVCYLLSVAIMLHVADRRVEYVHRLDFSWKRQLSVEQEEANTTRWVNKMLLLNILPLHVADLYLNTKRNTDGLYHEEYKAVAVLFASIPNYTDFYTENDMNDEGVRCLQLLNEIIRDFDTLLYEPQFERIEKIKLVGSTYMAACGLAPGRKDSSEPEDDVSGGTCALVMVRFALAMREVLATLNRDALQEFRLRIGIDCGPVIAGVVGDQKPLYDIWGDTVNMASRMDYTGLPDRIQVTEATARLLTKEGVRCELRGRTFVKGKGLMVTYWVDPASAYGQSELSDTYVEPSFHYGSCIDEEGERSETESAADEFFPPPNGNEGRMSIPGCAVAHTNEPETEETTRL